MSVTDNSTVKVHYTGKLKNQEVFDTSLDREPLQATLGQGQLIAGFENALKGMEPGDKKNFIIPADEGYGQRKDELVIKVPKNQLPQDLDIQVGAMLQMTLQNQQTIPVRVVVINENEVTLDANHPLAGEELHFDIELLEIL